MELLKTWSNKVVKFLISSLSFISLVSFVIGEQDDSTESGQTTWSFSNIWKELFYQLLNRM